MGTKTVWWGDGGRVLLRCVMDEEVYKLVMERVYDARSFADSLRLEKFDRSMVRCRAFLGQHVLLVCGLQ
jgi:hypothetical protein